jgi:hypothetical protein
MSSLLERRSHVSMIEDFTVVNDPAGFVFVGHRLMATGHIDDAESAMAQMRPIIVEVAEIVGAAVADLVGHTA